MPQPPFAARLLLRLFLSKAHNESIIGDLAEDYALNVLPRLGGARANLWYWRNALSAITARLGTQPQLSPDKERTRLMTGFMQDLRYAVRTLRQNPGFAATAIIALALGIGVNTAIFTIFDQMAFRPLPVKDSHRRIRRDRQYVRSRQDDGVTHFEKTARNSTPATFPGRIDWSRQDVVLV